MTVSVGNVLETMNTVMNGVNSALKLPGINMVPYVSTVSGIISTIDMVYKAGKDVTPYITEIQKTFGPSGAPSQADVDALHAKIKDLESAIDEPLPPAEAGEPD